MEEMSDISNIKRKSVFSCEEGMAGFLCIHNITFSMCIINKFYYFRNILALSTLTGIFLPLHLRLYDCKNINSVILV